MREPFNKISALLTPCILIILLLGCRSSQVVEETSTAAEVESVTVFTRTSPLDIPVLDGQEKSIVVIGYSTSFVWPTMLQDMLDAHAGERMYHILNAAVSASPVQRWIAKPQSKGYQATYGAMRRDYFGETARLREEIPAPTIALCQQSLQRTLAHKGPVPSLQDKRGIEIGANALEQLATRLYHDGIEKVYMATHIYKTGYEPEVGNERFALHALIQRNHPFLFEGPDLWSLTLTEYPSGFANDGVHPNERGAKVMAEAWYRTIAGEKADQSVIDEMHSRPYNVEAIKKKYRGLRQAR